MVFWCPLSCARARLSLQHLGEALWGRDWPYGGLLSERRCWHRTTGAKWGERVGPAYRLRHDGSREILEEVKRRVGKDRALQCHGLECAQAVEEILRLGGNVLRRFRDQHRIRLFRTRKHVPRDCGNNQYHGGSG